MVNYLEDYKRLLQKGVDVYDQIIQLYTPDKRAERDWADITLMQARTKRNGFLERLATPPAKVTAENTSPLMLSIGHFIDDHWADYQELPAANPEKRTRVEQLHAELEQIANGIGQIYNAVRTP